MILFMVGSDVIEFGDGEKSNIFVASMVVLIAYEREREGCFVFVLYCLVTEK